MQSRRRFLQLSFATLLLSAAKAVLSNGEPLDVVPAPVPTPTSPPQVARAIQQVRLPLVLLNEAPLAATFVPASSLASQQVYLPLLQDKAPALIGAPLLGPASGSAEQAIAW